MNHDRYIDLQVTNDYLEYEFMSIGPKGAISKVIQFTPTRDETIFNLALGNKKKDGGIDDMARDDNKDRDKILATVVSVLRIFFAAYPEKWIFFTGSSPERTRLYRMAITLNYETLSTDFEIVGLLRDMDAFLDVPFERGIDYFGFLVRLKNV